MKERFLEIVRKWKHFWMNQTQNSEEDRQNYFNRAFGIDANMSHHLADLLHKEFKGCAIVPEETLYGLHDVIRSFLKGETNPEEWTPRAREALRTVSPE